MSSSLPGALGRAVDTSLRDGEAIEMEVHMNWGEAIAVTDQRVLILKGGLQGNAGLLGSKAVSYPYRSISSVEHRQGFLGGHVTILAAGVFESHPNSFTRNRERENVVTYQSTQLRGTVHKVVELIQAKVEEANRAPGPQSNGLAEQLAKLGDLRDKGILTDDEFAAAKQRLISSEATK